MKLYQIRHKMYFKQRTILLQNKQKYNINRRKFHSFLQNNHNNPNEPFWVIIIGGLSYYYFTKWYNKK
jgi:hypothetical protein